MAVSQIDLDKILEFNEVIVILYRLFYTKEIFIVMEHFVCKKVLFIIDFIAELSFVFFSRKEINC